MHILDKSVGTFLKAAIQQAAFREPGTVILQASITPAGRVTFYKEKTISLADFW